MKQFFKFIFASCLGTILAVFALIALISMVGVMMGSNKEGIASDSVLLLEFDTPVPELSRNVPQQGLTLESNPNIGLHEITKLINHAASDPKIKGILYKASPTNVLGTVTASSIRESLKKFRDSSNKFVYAYGDFFDNSSYLIASSSDSIFANPMGTVDVNGYATMIPFFKGAMDKLDLEMDIYYAGQFKSATEPFRRENMSEQNKRQTREYLNDNYQLYLKEVAEARDIPVANLTDVINDLDFDNTDKALTNKLIDGKRHWYEVEDLLRSKLGIKEGRTVSYTSIEDYASNTTLLRGSSKNRIAVVYAEGNVVYADDNRGNINERTYHEVFDKIRKDKKVKAVVLRVNSGGGSAFTSDVIWKEMKTLQAKGIPIIASFGDYAASGGYYIAASADKIVSHPKTLTGSIGVFSMLPNFSGLMENKLGITFDTVKTSPHAIVASPFYKRNPQEDEALQRFTDNMYQIFLSRVAEGRGKTIDEIHEVAQGRVWTGQRAVEQGLVDTLGGLNTAIELAARVADVSDSYKVVEYPKITQEFWEQIIAELNLESAQLYAKKLATPKLTKTEAKLYETFNELRTVMSYKEPMARMPFMIKN